ncbi:MAG: CbtB-domain containing protein [Proteobacteria bacterium]|nr:CbtB-domain containing protein [Pseudomonadota bacterium]
MTVQSSVSTATTDQTIALAGDRKKKTAAFLVIAFGALLVWGTTYANPLTLHNAAHDSRHAFGFPCH